MAAADSAALATIHEHNIDTAFNKQDTTTTYATQDRTDLSSCHSREGAPSDEPDGNHPLSPSDTHLHPRSQCVVRTLDHAARSPPPPAPLADPLAAQSASMSPPRQSVCPGWRNTCVPCRPLGGTGGGLGHVYHPARSAARPLDAVTRLPLYAQS